MYKKTKYKWLLFDADGTLFDYDNAEAWALRATFGEHGIGYRDSYQPIYRKINDIMFKDFELGRISSMRLITKRFEMMFSQLNIEQSVEEFSEHYLTNLSKGKDLLPYALETVCRLHPNHEMLLITNGIGNVQRPRFENSTLRPYFSDIVISDEVGVAKPGIEIFKAAFKKMGDPRKEDVLIIGDSLTSDMKGGVNFGIDRCWFNPEGKSNPNGVAITYEISDLRQLVDVLGS
ncbi:MAG: noncanonical pyrimidine nucleotidase, YjjG family [Proteobacteria bacterium]|nr:noncanonical pyrimidine nucleotidase, YjjG family [Pseudomonadota bacterium]